MQLQDCLSGPGGGRCVGGFGNHESDVSAYSASGMDHDRIFLIDK